MTRRTRYFVAAGVAVIGTSAGAVAVAVAMTTDDHETPITGIDLERASHAALAHTGQGRVTGTEIGDEDSYYEVEVTVDDGSQVDVQLDEDFNVVGANADREDDVDADGS